MMCCVNMDRVRWGSDHEVDEPVSHLWIADGAKLSFIHPV
jgi:hypothetical protein